MIAQHFTSFRIALFVGLLLCGARFAGCRYMRLMDMRGLDYRLSQRGTQPGSPEIVIVAIDDASLDKLGRWPWSRATIAQLVDRLTAAGAAAIGFDIVQSEATVVHDVATLPDRIEGVDDHTWTTIRRALAGESSEDALLAVSVRKSGRTVLGYFFDLNPERAEPAAVRVSTYNVVHNSRGGRGEQAIPRALFARGNLPELTEAAREVGYFNFLPDSDGSYRRVPLAIRYRDEIALPLSLAVLRVYRPQVPLAIRFDDAGVEAIHFGTEDVPAAEDGQLLINYRGPGRTFRHVSAAAVLAGEVAPEAFHDKVVLVGVTANALADVRVTPFDGLFPGVEIHATVIDNVLRNDFIAQPKVMVLADMGMIMVLVLLLGGALHYVRGVVSVLAAIALAGAYLAGSQWVFVTRGWPLSLVYPLAAVGITYVGISLQHYVLEERERRKTRRTLELYLSPSLARLVSEHPDRLKLGGEKRERTVLFSDIRGFTTISEGLEPEVLVELLNAYLGEMTDVIFRYDGMLDKYIGDAIMAVWGAPLPQADHAALACAAALGMRQRLRALQEEWRGRGWPHLAIGIGLNSGPMVFGNMGSTQHLSLTVMGDNVNLGSRLEGLTKYYGTSIIASETTVNAAAEALVTRELDLVRVKGKRLPVRIFEILAPATERAQWQPMVERFESGLHLYRSQRWDEAAAMLGGLLEQHPEDAPTRLYLERIREMQAAPPGPEWDGVTTMEVK